MFFELIIFKETNGDISGDSIGSSRVKGEFKICEVTIKFEISISSDQYNLERAGEEVNDCFFTRIKVQRPSLAHSFV